MKLGDVYRTAVKAADTELAEVLSAKYATGAPEERHFQLSRQEDLAASKATYESAALHSRPRKSPIY